ncbi:hypothetical protein M9H77_23521 [Catharanthus roseus]|uniref:Uncharacterized protein n=1 Tax=Catharanthus roseus TaxID=4058 RepID=A0ACC0AT92_CATRO|nr:hypothetical protein M9H77_23521 [Catharanthus roseus]
MIKDWLPELVLNPPVTSRCCCWIGPLRASASGPAIYSQPCPEKKRKRDPFLKKKTGTGLGIRRNGGPVCGSNNPHNSDMRARKRLQLFGALVDRRLPRVDLRDPQELLSSVDLAQGSILKPSLFISAFFGRSLLLFLPILLDLFIFC